MSCLPPHLGGVFTVAYHVVDILAQSNSLVQVSVTIAGGPIREKHCPPSESTRSPKVQPYVRLESKFPAHEYSD